MRGKEQEEKGGRGVDVNSSLRNRRGRNTNLSRQEKKQTASLRTEQLKLTKRNVRSADSMKEGAQQTHGGISEQEGKTIQRNNH